MSIHTAPNIPTITTDSELTIPGFRERAQDAQSSVNVVCEQPKDRSRTYRNPRILPSPSSLKRG